MQTMTTTEAFRKIGRIGIEVQDQPIKLTTRGVPIAVLMSWRDYRAKNCCCEVGEEADILCPKHGFGVSDE